MNVRVGGRLGDRQGDIGERGRRPVLVLRACRLRRFLGFAGPRTGSWRRAWPGKDRGLRVRPLSGHTCGKNQSKSAPICGSRDVGVAAPASRPTRRSKLALTSGEPVAWQRFWLTSPTLGRMPGTVVQVAGGGKPKTRENRPLQPKPGAVKAAVMQRTGSSAVGSRWPIIPKREDRQVCLITC